MENMCDGGTRPGQPKAKQEGSSDLPLVLQQRGLGQVTEPCWAAMASSVKGGQDVQWSRLTSSSFPQTTLMSELGTLPLSPLSPGLGPP